MEELWPSGVALWGEASNHLELRWLKTVVVSVEEKAHVMRQVGIGKASVSEPLMTCREVEVTSKPGRSVVVRDEPGGCPFIGQVVSGMKAARARSAASAWNWGRQAPTPRDRAVARRGGQARGSASGGGNRQALSTVAAAAGGPARSSGEAPVIGVERRSRLIRGEFTWATGPGLGGLG
jgi:hypothetical protein